MNHREEAERLLAGVSEMSEAMDGKALMPNAAQALTAQLGLFVARAQAHATLAMSEPLRETMRDGEITAILQLVISYGMAREQGSGKNKEILEEIESKLKVTARPGEPLRPLIQWKVQPGTVRIYLDGELIGMVPEARSVIDLVLTLGQTLGATVERLAS